LIGVRSGLIAIRSEAHASLANWESETSAHRFLITLSAYASSLDEAVGRLEEICRGLSERAERRPSPGWRDYRRSLAIYHASCARYRKLGIDLNATFAQFKSDRPYERLSPEAMKRAVQYLKDEALSGNLRFKKD
jgi:hypothetical protein